MQDHDELPKVLIPVLPLTLNSSEYSALPFIAPYIAALTMSELLDKDTTSDDKEKPS